MDKAAGVALLMVVIMLVFAAVGFVLFKVFNSEDGERYRKRRMQGPFVPLSAEEIAEDEARILQARKKP